MANPTLSTTCHDVHHYRTLVSLIQSCASTAFLCAWVVLHPDVPENPYESLWRSLGRRIAFMVMSILAPEATFVRAYRDWTKAAECMSILIQERPDCDWTETHGLFAFMGGFRLVKEDGSTKQLKGIEAFKSIVSGEIDIPNIKLEEILDRSKGDEIAKAIVLIQTLWFALQVINRTVQHLPVTALEVTTVAHVAFNVLIYWCWWNKPLNIRIPVDVHAKKNLEIVEAQFDEHAGANERGSDEPMEGDPMNGGGLGSSTQQMNDEIRSQEAMNGEDLPPVGEPRSDDTCEGAPEAKEDSVTETSLRNGEEQDIRSDADQAKDISARMEEGRSRNDTSSGDQGINESIGLLDDADGKESPKNLPRLSTHIKIGGYLSAMRRPLGLAMIGFSLCALSAIFGAIHCAAWNLDFTTHLESTLWRVSSIIVTVTPTIVIASPMLAPKVDYELTTHVTRVFGLVLVFIIGPAYVFGRVCLLVLSLFALRSLPEKAFLIPSWTLYIPHIS